MKNIIPTDESLKRQITDSISEHLTDSDLERPIDWPFHLNFRFLILLYIFNFECRYEKNCLFQKDLKIFLNANLALVNIKLKLSASIKMRMCSLRPIEPQVN